MSKIFISALEASGDTHGAALVQAIRQIDPSVQFEGLGGLEMKRAGVELLEEMTPASVLGFGDVLKKYLYFRKVFYRTLGHIQKTRPGLLLFIDSPAFHLRLAKKIKRRTPLIYYIAPQIWAWGARRIRTIRKTVDHMIVILPFEEEIYRKAGVPCTFVGHPLLDRVKPSRPREALRKEFGLSTERVIALLPGSREPEVRRILPIMLESVRLLQKNIPNLKFFMTETPHVPREIYALILGKFPDLSIRRTTERLYDIVHLSDFALVASGTATLETALLGTPFFLLYKASASTFFLGRRLVKIPYIGLVNVLAGRHVVPEYIQHLAVPEKIAHDAKLFLENPEWQKKLGSEVQEVLGKLGKPGATERAARVVVSLLRAKPAIPASVPGAPAGTRAG